MHFYAHDADAGYDYDKPQNPTVWKRNTQVFSWVTEPIRAHRLLGGAVSWTGTTDLPPTNSVHLLQKAPHNFSGSWVRRRS